MGAASAQAQRPDTSAWHNPIVTGAHADEGPADRYTRPYDPITFGQSTKAPLPGLGYDYKLFDWDQDGRMDLLATVRRGGGLVVYRNVGTPEQPLFRMLHENEVLLRAPTLGRFFALLDVDGNGTTEIASYQIQGKDTAAERGAVRLVIHYNRGTRDAPDWDARPAVFPDGTPLVSPPDIWASPTLDAADWDGDGRTDLVIGTTSVDAMVPPRLPMLKNNRMQGFRDPSVYRPDVAAFYVLRNAGGDDGRAPVFARPERLAADGEPIRAFAFSYPTVHDFTGDGLPDLLAGSHRPGLRLYRNAGTRAAPKLTDAGLFADTSGRPIRSSLALRVATADLDGDGRADLVTSSYFGNADRYLLFTHEEGSAPKEGWRFQDYLSIQATPSTPVYGMGNSTVDPVDWDGDGDTDLLLGGEPAVPLLVRNVGTETSRVFAAPERLRWAGGDPLETYAIETGTGSVWGPLEWYTDRSTPRAADWDGDGTLDLVSGSMGRRLYWLRGRRMDGELRFERPRLFRRGGAELVAPDRDFPAVLDWTGDGHLDAVVGDTSGHVLVYPGDGTTELGAPLVLESASGGPLVITDYWDRAQGNRTGYAVADWNGDGLRDLVIFRFHLGVWVYLNTGDDRFDAGHKLVTMYSHLAGPSVMDWNGDGILDLVMGGDERRMIEPRIPAHLVVYYGQDLAYPPTQPTSGAPGE